MEAFNSFFKNAAKKLNLPDFFQRKPLIFNNFFLVIAIAFLLIVLLLIIFLVPGRKKRKAKKEAKRREAELLEKRDAQEDVAEEAAPAEVIAEPVAVEEAPAEEKTPVVEEAVETTAPEEVATPVEETPAEEAIEESAQAEPVAVEVTEETVVEEEEASAPAPEEKSIEEEKAPIAEKKASPAKKPVAEKKATPVKEVAAASEKDDSFRNGGKYEIVRRMGSYYFLLKANNGQLLLESTSYTTEAGAKKAIETFKNAVEVGEFNIDEDKNGNYKFILRASARSQMLYHGESYGTRQSAENAIQSVKNFAFRSVIRRAEENDIGGEESEASVVALTPLKPSDHKLGGKYEIVERSGSFYFLLKANNGQLLVESPAFTTEAGAKAGIESFKKAAESGIFMIDSDKNGNFKFILRASARSQLRYFGESYSTRQSAENSVNSVRCFAQKAVLK